MTIKCFGYEDDDRGRPLVLRDVTLLVDAGALRLLAQFFNACADGIQASPDWEHEHFSERFPEGRVASDVIVFNAARDPEQND